MRTEELWIEADDGKRLFAYHWTPERPARGVVQILHGMAEHVARYVPTAEALTRAGYAVVAHDQRGHGRTIASPDEQGHFADREGWAKVLADVGSVNRRARELHPGSRVCLFAHSMGSFVAQDYVRRRLGGIDALVLSGSNIGGGAMVGLGRIAARIERARQGARGKSALLADLSFGAYNKPFQPARTEFDWLSRDPRVVDAYIADPLCGFRCTNQMWVDLLDALSGIGTRQALRNIPPELPILVIAGSRDPVSQGTRGLVRLLRAYERVGLRRVEHRFYPDGRHEMLNETNREEVWRDLVGWLDANLAAG